MALRDVQARLRPYGYTGALDGLWGPGSEAAALRALDIADTAQRPPDAAYSPVATYSAAARLLAQQPFAARPITEIVIHCTATPEGRAVSVDTIRGWHKANGWSDIGYHYVVLLDGTVQPGRPEAKAGAHVAGHNIGTLGVVYVGGCDAEMQPKDTRTPAQKEALMALCKALTVKYPRISKISGHRDYAAKACPSFDVHSDPLGALV